MENYNYNEVFVRVIDFMRRCKAEEDANEGIVSIIASSLRDTLNVMICQLQYVMISDRNVSNSIAMRQGEECSSILDTNRDKLHCLKSKIIGHLKRFIHYIYETIERLPASKAEDDMIKRAIISNDLLLWVLLLDSDQKGEDKEVSSGVACSADDFQFMEEEDNAGLDMAQHMSRTCSNDESSGLKSDEQTSTSRDNDSPQPVPVSEDESTRSKFDELSLDELSLCLSKEGLSAIDSVLERFSFEQLYVESMGNTTPTPVVYCTGADLDQAGISHPQRLNQYTQDVASYPDDLEDFCSDWGIASQPDDPPQTLIDHLNELERGLRDKLQATGLLPQQDVSEFIKTLLRLSHGEIFRVLAEYQRGLGTDTLNDEALLRELLQGSAWLQASTPMLYMSWADFETCDLTQILATNLYRNQKELESKISAFLECDFQFTDIIHFLLFTFACKTYLRRDDELPFQLPNERVNLPLPGEQDLCNHVVVVEAILDEM